MLKCAQKTTCFVFPQIFYPNFLIFLHRYICHICDILQLWCHLWRMLITRVARCLSAPGLPQKEANKRLTMCLHLVIHMLRFCILFKRLYGMYFVNMSFEYEWPFSACFKNQIVWNMTS